MISTAPTPTILIVDDSQVERETAGGCVRHQGLKALFAEDGAQALKVIEEQQPDIVLTDLRMPNVDGLELVERLRRDHPNLPVILMTAYGNEDVAAAALKAGAASYVAKRNLALRLPEALKMVLSSVRAAEERARVKSFMENHESHFVLDYEPAGPRALIAYLQESLQMLRFCDHNSILQISTALSEAIANAIEHGNLELDSQLRQQGDETYRKLGRQRSREKPYSDRRVHVFTKLTKEQATFTIRDEGLGFDFRGLPDPTDPENLLKPFGRGVLLIRTFMDEVKYNEKGNEVKMTKMRQSNAAIE